eukprot:444388-Heterocapsa_arctica.AAC.1
MYYVLGASSVLVQAATPKRLCSVSAYRVKHAASEPRSQGEPRSPLLALLGSIYARSLPVQLGSDA